jgi:hypothetical protein
MSAHFKVVNWAARMPGRTSRADWCAWAGGVEVSTDAPPPAELPMMLRRRLTPIGQAALAVAAEASPSAASRYVFCSRHGEFSRTMRLLKAVAEHEPLSPADFSVSVHNALAGILSIARQAHSGHTALANGDESFAAGLLEAAALIATGADRQVLLVYFDDDLPAPYDEIEPPDGNGALAAAMLFGTSDEAGTAVRVTLEPTDGRPPGPKHQALDFLRFLASGEPARLVAGSFWGLRCARAG